MRRGSVELSDQSVRTWVPFIRRKVLVGRRITRLTELLWAIHLFLHFPTKPGETFIIHRPRGYNLCYCHLSLIFMKERQSYIGVFLKKHDGSGIITISLRLFYNHDTHDEAKRTLSHPVDHPIHFCSYLQLLVFTIYLSSLYLILSLGDEHETSFSLCVFIGRTCCSDMHLLH